ncbi:MAG: molybdenum ABC transporter ATP-binding protein [Alphaproteobacteria bacterium]
MTVIVARIEHTRGDFTLDVDLRLPGVGVTALFGPSGSGKSTLLRCIAGLERAAGGVVKVGAATWQDERVFLPPHRRPVGLVFQDARLFRHMSVRDNLLYGYRRVAASRRRLAPDEAIALLGLGALLDRRPAQLSGGEAQRVAIGRALLAGPDLLLLDEPLASVDVGRKGEIVPFLERLHRELAIPVVLVTHDVDDVVRLADRAVLLDNGRVVAEGPVAEALAHVAGHGGAAALAVAIEVTVVASLADGRFDVELPGGRRVTLSGQLPANGARLRIAARDVSLGLAPPGPSSALFSVPARVRHVPDGDAPHVALPLDIEGMTLFALVPRHALAELALTPGALVHATIHHARLV